MRIIALDASTEQCAVALGDGTSWRERAETAGQRHSELLLPMVQELLAEEGLALAGIDGFAFGAGPGSFTGLRIACGVAQGLAFGANLKVVPVPSLAAIAQAQGSERVVACLDARMREVYVAAYARRDASTTTASVPGAAPPWDVVIEPAVLSPHDVPIPEGEGWVGAGNGFAAYPELGLRLGLAQVEPHVRPSSRAIGALALADFAAGRARPPEEALPLYVRHRVALTTAEREAGLKL